MHYHEEANDLKWRLAKLVEKCETFEKELREAKERNESLRTENSSLRQGIDSISTDFTQLKDSKPNIASLICKICLDHVISVVLYPCKHVALCEACTKTIEASSNECPLCRTKIRWAGRIYLN